MDITSLTRSWDNTRPCNYCICSCTDGVLTLSVTGHQHHLSTVLIQVWCYAVVVPVLFCVGSILAEISGFNSITSFIAQLFVSIFHSFDAGIANASSSFKSKLFF